jgi:hypothetical protein
MCNPAVDRESFRVDPSEFSVNSAAAVVIGSSLTSGVGHDSTVRQLAYG